jgi:hypothetical protein
MFLEEHCENVHIKAIYRFKTIHIKILMTFFKELEKEILKFVQNHERPLIARKIVSKKKKAASIKVPDFKIHCKAIVAKAAWYWHFKKYT